MTPVPSFVLYRDKTPQEFGAEGDGVADDTVALQNCINDAATTGKNVYIPPGHYKFTKLYLYYDAVLNPGWPSDPDYEGRIEIYGSGSLSHFNFSPTDNFKRTVLDSTDATGPAIECKSVDVGYPYVASNIKIRDLTIRASNTTQIIKLYHTNVLSGLENLYLEQEGSITITDGTNIFLNGSVNFVMANTDTLTLIQKSDGKWYEVARSVN